MLTTIILFRFSGERNNWSGVAQQLLSRTGRLHVIRGSLDWRLKSHLANPTDNITAITFPGSEL